ncbi:hypothetical protein BDP55DRAFT_711156 [Colletotrichum godetiae]|uniref:Uncharacterized protein n=1 Tax=Colletotrichum godetiae TaxID=1209918 RepID=A0AAJ0AWA4_9PEZI|nr:uncharacterized protein BDP55DRAFT_711156 [Colletotrichum godetiae]KAK1691563.1 hypothetical protein BDP55DRAFT_711156 [Colletotrichum godetiae]
MRVLRFRVPQQPLLSGGVVSVVITNPWTARQVAGLNQVWNAPIQRPLNHFLHSRILSMKLQRNYSRASSIQIKSETSPEVDQQTVSGRVKDSDRQVVDGRDRQVARQARRQGTDMTEGIGRQVVGGSDGQAVQSFGMNDAIQSRGSPGNMPIVPAKKCHRLRFDKRNNDRSQNNNRDHNTNDTRQIYKHRPETNTHVWFRRMGPSPP